MTTESDPWQGDPIGVATLLILTAVAGGLDAMAFLFMGGAFVSAQTGTVLLLAMNASGNHAVDTPAAVASLGSFLAGAAVAGRVMPVGDRSRKWPREALLLVAVEVVLLTASALIAWDGDLGPAWLVAPAAAAMGLQASLARRFGIRYLTTGYITGSTTAAVMGSPFGDDSNRSWWYAAIPILFLAGGALTMGFVASHNLPLGLFIAAATVAGATLLVGRGVRHDHDATGDPEG